MACDCLARTDELLRGRNTRLGVALSLTGKPPKAMLVTELIAKQRGAKPLNVVATFCPVCGVRYEPEGS